MYQYFKVKKLPGFIIGFTLNLYSNSKTDLFMMNSPR